LKAALCVVDREKERQATVYGKGSHAEGAMEMMKRGEFTPQKRHRATTDNEEANRAQKEEMHRQGCRNYRNIAQSGNERYAGATWDGEQYELQQVPIDNSSTTSGVFAANPHRPIFNPYTHRSNYKNTRYLKHKRNRRYKERQFKLAYAHQQERDQNPERKKHKRSVETKKQKGKRQIDTRKSPPLIQTDL
jgi:hypothetical protein